MNRYILVSIAICLLAAFPAYAVLSCTVTSVCSNPSVIVGRLSSTTGGHAETSSGTTYTNLICCNGVSNLGNSCNGTYATVLKLAATTNSHVQQGDQSGYNNSICLSDSTAGDNVTIAYQNTNCSGYDTTVASISGITNAHVGDSSAYTKKICASISQASLTVNISDTTIGFSTLSLGSGRWATGDTVGTPATSGALPTAAHTVSVTTSASGGYTMSYQGALPTNGGNTIAATTITNDSDGTPGTEQFGLAASTNGSSTVTNGYTRGVNTSWAFVPSTTNILVSRSSSLAGTETTSVSYLANISTTTVTGSYNTAITYVVTANF